MQNMTIKSKPLPDENDEDDKNENSNADADKSGDTAQTAGLNGNVDKAT